MPLKLYSNLSITIDSLGTAAMSNFEFFLFDSARKYWTSFGHYCPGQFLSSKPVVTPKPKMILT